MADQTIKVGKSFTQIQVGQGEFTLFLNQNSQYFTVSRSANGDNAIVSNKTLRFTGPATIYVKGTNDESFVALSDFFKTSSGGGTTPTPPIPGQTYNFNAPLVENLGNVSIALSQSLQVLNDTLDLNLNGNQDFKNVLLGLNEAVKVTDIPQDIDGLKKFLKETKTNNLVSTENGANYGAVDIRNQDGYFSISEDGGSAGITKLAALGFVDSTTTFRIRNLTGGVVTFDTLAQYESTLTPSDDKDLVNLAYVRQVKEELKVLIQSLQGGLHFVGVISNTKQECESNPDLLTQFVQTQERRAPRNGDFVKTNDNYGFIYNGTNWINFGQVSISIATTTTAGIMMFGTSDGELEDLGNGKAKVIGWDTVKQALTDLNGRITTNTQSISTLDRQSVKLTGDQSIAGNKTFTGSSKFTGFVDVDAAPYSLSANNYCMMRFVGDKWTDGQSADLIRFHKYGAACGYRIYLNGTYFNYAEIFGSTLISNMKDPTEDSHGANVRWVKGYSLPKVTTNAVNTIQVSSSSSKYFNFDYVVEGTGYRNWSGIQLRAKQDVGSFETMWKIEYRNSNDLGIYMSCIGNKLNFESDTKIVGVSCEDSDGEKTAANKKYVDDAKAALKAELKQIAANSADFNDFKARMTNW